MLFPFEVIFRPVLATTAPLGVQDTMFRTSRPQGLASPTGHANRVLYGLREATLLLPDWSESFNRGFQP